MKKHAVLIQCHNKPEQINKIIEILPAENFDFYIHVDKKSDIIDKIVKQENVFFSERVDVQWGRGSQVVATINLLKILDTNKYSYVHLISGNDFIIKNPYEIISFFENNDLEYIESNPLDKDCTWSWHGMDRVRCYYPQWMIRRPKEKFFKISRILYREFIMRTKIFKRRNLPVKEFFGGSQWFSLTGKMIDWILGYLDNNPDYIEFFQHGVCVDEVFFSTLVKYSPFADKIANNHLRYMKWDTGISTGGPATLTEYDFEDMITSEFIWARKFDDIKTVEKLADRLERQ